VTASKKFNLEKALNDLENLVEELEDAEQKVEILLQSAGGEELEDFEVEDD
jgi:exonuclease VII small subunit